MRRYETDYAGAWRGFCKSRESAIAAATRHIVSDGYSRCTITDRVTGSPVARLRINDDRTRVIIETVKPMKAVGL